MLHFSHFLPSLAHPARAAACWLGLALFSATAFAQSVDDANLPEPSEAPQGDGQVSIKETNYPIPANGAVRYFSPSGNNANAGTAASPWRTPTQALFDDNTKVPAGATLIFESGTYPVDNVLIKKKLTLQPRPGAQAWLTGSLPLPASAWERDPANNALWRTKQAWTYEFGSYLDECPDCIERQCPSGKLAKIENNVWCTPTEKGLESALRDMLFNNGVGLKQVRNKGAVRAATATAPATFFIDRATDRIYIAFNPTQTGTRLEASAYETGLTVRGQGALTQVRGLGLRGFAHTALSSEVRGVVLENCTVAWNAILGAQFWLDPRGVKVRGNTFSYNGEKGLGLSRVISSIDPELGPAEVEGNTISYNNVEGFAKYWNAAGVKVGRLNDVVFRNNLIENNNSTALWLDIDADQTQVLGNVVRNNASIGIFFEISRGALIAGNVCYGNGAGIQISESEGVAILHNTLVANNVNLRINDGTGRPQETRYVEVRNNVLADGRAANLEVSNPTACTAGQPMVEALDHNLYLKSSAITSNSWKQLNQWNPTGCASPNHRAYSDLAAFKDAYATAATRYEANGAERSGLALNAYFANPSPTGSQTPDFRLQPCNGWSAPAAWALPTTIGVAPASGSTPAFTVSSSVVRAALPGAPASGALRMGAEQALATCAKTAQTITFTKPADQTLGAAPFALAATASSGLPVSFTVVSGPAEIVGTDADQLKVTGVGQVVVRATQAGNATYAAATPVEQTFAVVAAPTGGTTAGTLGLEGATLGPQAAAGYTAILGFVFEDAGPGTDVLQVYGPAQGYADQVIHSNNWGRAIRLRQADNSVFNLTSLQYAAGRHGDAADATVTGTFADGSTQTKTFAATAGNKRMTLLTTNWTGLKAVVVDFRGGANEAYGALDNFNVSKPAEAARSATAASAAGLAAEPDGAASFSAYPNPSPDGRATLTLTAEEAQTAQLYLYNRQGAFVGLLAVPVRAHAPTEFRLPGTLPEGEYMLKTKLDGRERSFRLHVRP